MMMIIIIISLGLLICLRLDRYRGHPRGRNAAFRSGAFVGGWRRIVKFKTETKTIAFNMLVTAKIERSEQRLSYIYF